MLSLEGRKSTYVHFGMRIFCPFYILKYRHMKQVTRAALKSHIHKYFACYIIFQLFKNNSKAKLVVTVS